ncbi:MULTISPECIES: FAD-dependent oxidoreductase [unclassified Bradyrhizobium]|uniref:NAD(P)/FAD-dependent oxidoreductase n=1 Tax=unclassified Bradyrhizobium TaxID=2631580 RepID=UPI001CD7D309|nr:MULTISPECIES: FAD-dependent oxidoreductase [unclassified Bradyrhizobium]MCA1425029.1 FAD-dependent oxidoreductase [Bradyrhizobium sp. NBAIM16]MCA1502366.1 FAD-dependent oxidoreductase [Bradyrhizobium sp. NBAIM02]
MTGLVIIGASYAGVQAALTARDAGYSQPITIVCDEEWLPYQRPPLSKDFLLGRISEQNLILRDKTFFEGKQINLVLGQRATLLDLRARQITLAGNNALKFEKLLFATGSRARRIAVEGADFDGIFYLRSVTDAIDLKAGLANAAEIVVVGGGFIGLEAAASAAKLGKKVTVVEASSRLLERAVSPVLSTFLLDTHLRAGVDVMLDETVASFKGNDRKVSAVVLGNGAVVHADLVLVGIGGVANDEIARSAGLRCTNGIVVDAHGQCETSDIFAAGDCANHFNRFCESWVRLESVQNAQDQAKAAGLAIAGARAPYENVPRFWSDQYDVKLQIVGLARRYDRQAVRGSVDDGRFSVFYYRQGRLVAVDSVNRPGEQMAARRLIAAGISPAPEQAADPSFDLKSLVTAGDKAGA